MTQDHQNEVLKTIHQISQIVVTGLPLNKLIPSVGRETQRIFDAQIAYVALLDKEKRTINFPYQYGDELPPLRLGEGLTSRVLLLGKPLLINGNIKDAYRRFEMDTVGRIPNCYLGVPIVTGKETSGVLSVQRIGKNQVFDEQDQQLLATIASSLSLALRNAQLQQDAQEAKAKVEKAHEVKNSFLSTVSHELRTPLTSVLGFAKIVKRRLEDRIFPNLQSEESQIQRAKQQVEKNLGIIISEGERLTQLINDVLDLAKIEAGKIEWQMEAIHLEEIINRSVEATKAQFQEKNLLLHKEIPNELPIMTGDRNKLSQVIINLLSNAAKFTDHGQVNIRVWQEDPALILSVADTGIGIAPEDQPKVFEKFNQIGDILTDKPKGTGLGLPICKEIIQHHGGKLWLESKLGQGSTFYFSLPLPHQTLDLETIQLEELVQQLDEQNPPEKNRPSYQKATILVVDDDQPIRALLSQELTEAGYIVREAANGKAALESIRSEHPDLILLDVMMPEMNGFDVAAVLKNDPKTMDIPIIILSIVHDKERGMRIGVDRYLTKPIDTEQLFYEVGSLLEQGQSKRKVMVVDEDASTIKNLAEVLHARGYQVVEANGRELKAKAKSVKPDIIILNSLLHKNQNIIKTLRFEKGMENVLFLLYE